MVQLKTLFRMARRHSPHWTQVQWVHSLFAMSQLLLLNDHHVPPLAVSSSSHHSGIATTHQSIGSTNIYNHPSSSRQDAHHHHLFFSSLSSSYVSRCSNSKDDNKDNHELRNELETMLKGGPSHLSSPPLENDDVSISTEEGASLVGKQEAGGVFEEGKQQLVESSTEATAQTSCSTVGVGVCLNPNQALQVSALLPSELLKLLDGHHLFFWNAEILRSIFQRLQYLRYALTLEELLHVAQLSYCYGGGGTTVVKLPYQFWAIEEICARLHHGELILQKKWEAAAEEQERGKFGDGELQTEIRKKEEEKKEVGNPKKRKSVAIIVLLPSLLPADWNQFLPDYYQMLPPRAHQHPPITLSQLTQCIEALIYSTAAAATRHCNVSAYSKQKLLCKSVLESLFCEIGEAKDPRKKQRSSCPTASTTTPEREIFFDESHSRILLETFSFDILPTFLTHFVACFPAVGEFLLQRYAQEIERRLGCHDRNITRKELCTDNLPEDGGCEESVLSWMEQSVGPLPWTTPQLSKLALTAFQFELRKIKAAKEQHQIGCIDDPVDDAVEFLHAHRAGFSLLLPSKQHLTTLISEFVVPSDEKCSTALDYLQEKLNQKVINRIRHGSETKEGEEKTKKESSSVAACSSLEELTARAEICLAAASSKSRLLKKMEENKSQKCSQKSQAEVEWGADEEEALCCCEKGCRSIRQHEEDNIITNKRNDHHHHYHHRLILIFSFILLGKILKNSPLPQLLNTTSRNKEDQGKNELLHRVQALIAKSA